MTAAGGSEEQSALAVVEGLMDRFEVADSNQVRETLESSGSAEEAFAALGDLGEYTSAVIDPGILIDFSSFQSALTPDAPTQFHGREGWIEMWRLWLAAWEDYEPQTELEQLNERQVLVTSNAKLKGRGSGVEMDWTTYGIWTVREGRLVGMHNFLGRDQALAAAGGKSLRRGPCVGLLSMGTPETQKRVLTDPSRRLEAMQPYMFAELERRIAAKREAGIDVISLGIGDPDEPTYPHVVKAMQEAVAEGANQKYPSNRGRDEFRSAFAGFYADRFGVDIDPESQVMPAIGAKECI
ncbi:MAG: aminotransferase class I/II-fold pyridoxal phosphate-dependent enzyme, partial [Solirubrobacterales bacterium]